LSSWFFPRSFLTFLAHPTLACIYAFLYYDFPLSELGQVLA